MLGILVGPEQTNQRIAATAAASGRKHYQQRQPLGLREHRAELMPVGTYDIDTT